MRGTLNLFAAAVATVVAVSGTTAVTTAVTTVATTSTAQAQARDIVRAFYIGARSRDRRSARGGYDAKFYYHNLRARRTGGSCWRTTRIRSKRKNGIWHVGAYVRCRYVQ